MGYVEGLNDARTLLADFFSILLDKHLHVRAFDHHFIPLDFRCGIRHADDRGDTVCQPCQGQVTTDPSTFPSPKWPPRWTQVLSITWKVPSTLKTARVLPFTSATIPWPGFTSVVPVTRTNSPIARPVLHLSVMFSQTGF